MISKFNFKRFLKDVVILSIAIFVISNMLSYMRAPKYVKGQLPSLGVELVENKPVIVHFWATWCPTCRVENSTIEKLSKEYNVITIAVASGSDKEIKDYMNKNELTFNVINDNTDRLTKLFNVGAFPTTFIYDKDHKLQFTEVGFTSYIGFKARISSL